MNTSIRDKLFQDIQRRVAKFRENGPTQGRRKIGGRNKKESADRTAQRQFQAGLRSDVGLMATWKGRFRLHVCCN